MKNNVAFTICATNYVGLGKVLEKSIYEHYSDLDFYIIVADEPRDDVRKEFDENVLIGKEILDYAEQKWYEMAFKYNLTEFCTAIKPASILYLLGKGYEKCIYFDPDIYVYSSLAVIYDKLDDYEAVVTPHILTPEVEYTGNLKELRLLYSGVYNMGFGAYKNTDDIQAYLRWWNKRLEDYCYGDSNMNLFTDQKWVDMLPCFLGNKLYVSRNKGMNVAPWNFHERKIEKKEGSLVVTHRFCQEATESLIFVHYSGYNYKTLLSGEIIQQNISDIKQYDDVLVLFDVYSKALNEATIDTYINEIYSYNYFTNRDYEISVPTRRLFRGYIDSGNNIPNPFRTDTVLFDRLKQKGFVKKGVKTKVTVYNEKAQSTQKAIKIINVCFKVVFHLLGPSRYYNLTRMLRKYAVWENHSFLITSKGEKYILRRL